MDPPIFVPHHQPGIFQHPQVFRYGRKRHIIRGGQIADGNFPLREARQNSAARGVGERRKSGVKGRL